MRIFIPTRGRIFSQHCWDLLSAIPGLKEHLSLVCPEEEYDKHRALGREVIARPDSVKNIAQSRQFIADYALDTFNEEFVIMLDDDLCFFNRIDPNAWNLQPLPQDQFIPLFKRLYEIGTVKGHASAGISPRQGNNYIFPDVELSNGKMNAVNAVNPRIMRDLGIRYDDVSVMEDYYVTLSLFERGYGNRIIADHAWDQRGASGAPGGCSMYRTPQIHAAGAKWLGDRFPDYVTVVTKAPKTGWGDGQKVRTDVRVQWKKCFKAGVARYGEQFTK